MTSTYLAALIFVLCLSGVVYLSFAVNYALDQRAIKKMGQMMVALLIVAFLALTHLYIEGAQIFFDFLKTL